MWTLAVCDSVLNCVDNKRTLAIRRLSQLTLLACLLSCNYDTYMMYHYRLSTLRLHAVAALRCLSQAVTDSVTRQARTIACSTRTRRYKPQGTGSRLRRSNIIGDIPIPLSREPRNQVTNSKQYVLPFLPSDATLAWRALWSCVRPSVCHKSVFYQNG